MPSLHRARLTLVAALALALPAALSAQADPVRDSIRFEIDPVLVTATRGPRPVSMTPRPATVIGQSKIDLLAPNTVADLFRDIPGLDVTGVGVNQGRPSIRGQSGQRILLLQDGLRLNNTRRESDFGELPALIGIGSVERVEVVRGPASVLYGSDAIGGVINVITRTPKGDGFHGSGSYRFGEVEGQNQFAGRISGRTGRFSILGGGSWRTADAYRAPAGTFGDITLGEDVLVQNSGVEDRNFDLRLGFDFDPDNSLFAKFESYGADDAGFGSVDPQDYAPEEATVDILYPEQSFRKFTTGFSSQNLGTALADRVELTGYLQNNDRELSLHLFAPFGPGTPPGAGVLVENMNTTDISTIGFRAEARKLVKDDVLVTWGVDGFRDHAEGTDLAVTTIVGFGPPMVSTSDSPNIPTAEYLSLGAFVQTEFGLGDRLSVVSGARYQDISAQTFTTAGLDAAPAELNTGTAVAAVNAIYELTDAVSLITSIGRGFRSPNLVESFFQGAVAEAGAYQVAATDLDSETSFNVDLGARFNQGRVSLEGFWFRNRITNGIRASAVTDASGAPVEIDGLPAYQNTNVDRLVYRGFELNGAVQVARGLEAGAGFSKLDAENELDPDSPVGEAFNSKLVMHLRYTSPGGRLYTQWDVRHSGEQQDTGLIGNPLGSTIPAFTVQNIRAGVRLFSAGGFDNRLNIAFTNLTDELYAESANAAFFRPEPKRNLTLMWEVAF